jgi:hypothetical protein
MVSSIAKQKKEVIELILQEHLIGLMVVEKHVFLTHHLPKTSLAAGKYVIEA